MPFRNPLGKFPAKLFKHCVLGLAQYLVPCNFGHQMIATETGNPPPPLNASHFNNLGFH